MYSLEKILNIISLNDLKKFLFLVLLSLIMAVIDMIGIASIMPFVAIISNMELLETNNYINFLFRSSALIGVTNQIQFIYFLGFLVFLLLIFSLAIKSLTLYLQLRFIYNQEYKIGVQLIENYLLQPYSWFLSRNSSELGKNILSEISIVVNQYLMPLLILITNIFTVLVLLLMLIFIDPLVIISVTIVLIILYLIFFFSAKGFLNIIGKKRLVSNQFRYSTVNESLSAFKEIKIAGLKNIYTQRFAECSKKFANYQTLSQIISRLPRFVVEAFAFGGMLIILLILIEKKDSLSAALPTLAIYIFAAYRIIPAVQQIYGAITQMRYSASSLDQLYSDFTISIKKKSEISDNSKILFLNKKIKLKNVYFSYPNSSSYSLKNINIEIKARSKVAFVGVSGSGKTTTIDLILGLLGVSKGNIEVDGKIIKENNIRAWQKNIGYVPQNIYLADDTIASNIAFGVDTDKIDYQAVERAAKIASIHNFITNDLKKKYQTIVGERGIRLSGGQRQRIGIARAFYYKPQVIILDEATSSLDDITEQAVMKSIYSLDYESTIILVAHRLRTIKGCDQIFLLNDGEIEAKGNYKELMLSNKTFKKMLEV